MTGNENYEELKGSAKSFLQAITSDNLYYGLFLLAVLLISLKLVSLAFKPLKKKGKLHVSFFEGCLKAFLVITIGMKICSLSQVLSSFTSQILMSSSLIVVVLGFVFQEGLTILFMALFCLFSDRFRSVTGCVSILTDSRSPAISSPLICEAPLSGM